MGALTCVHYQIARHICCLNFVQSRKRKPERKNIASRVAKVWEGDSKDIVSVFWKLWGVCFLQIELRRIIETSPDLAMCTTLWIIHLTNSWINSFGRVRKSQIPAGMKWDDRPQNPLTHKPLTSTHSYITHNPFHRRIARHIRSTIPAGKRFVLLPTKTLLLAGTANYSPAVSM